MKIFNKLKGDFGEEKAAKYLKRQKYKIIKRNFKNQLGEIDIIARQKDVVVFVEVKTRTDESFGYAAEAVDSKKQQKIRNVALLYTQKHNISNFRFDVVEVYLKDERINHIIDAF